MATKKRSYESVLSKQLKIIDGACNEIAAIALKNEMHPQHVKDINELLGNRVRRLKKQLDTREDDYEMTLSVLDEDSSNSKKADKKDDSEKKQDSQSESTSGPGFGKSPGIN